MFATSDIPSWSPHPEVWLLIVAIVGFGLYAARVIQPNAVVAGGEPISSRQKWWFVAGVVMVWLASDWPIHDIAEERLYSVHMVQHMLLTVVVPPMFLLATPDWLGRYIIGDGAVDRWFRRLARPIPAAVGYNVLAAATHWAGIVNLTARNGAFHYLMHALIILTAFLVWVPICGPFRELQLSEPGKMIYIFLLSIIPTVPAAFLTAADGPLYEVYNREPRLWGIGVVDDQQLAGVVMKLIEGLYLWAIILVLFLRWMDQDRPKGDDPFRGKLVRSGSA